MSKRASREGTGPASLKGAVSDPATTNSRDSPLTLPEQEPTFHASKVPPGEPSCARLLGRFSSLGAVAAAHPKYLSVAIGHIVPASMPVC